MIFMDDLIASLFLASLVKKYSNSEISLNVMRDLPREWDVKMVAMRESKDLKKTGVARLVC